MAMAIFLNWGLYAKSKIPEGRITCSSFFQKLSTLYQNPTIKPFRSFSQIRNPLITHLFAVHIHNSAINTHAIYAYNSSKAKHPSMAANYELEAADSDQNMNAAIDSNQNVLQKHAAFFDRNKDGLIYPWETYQGFRAIGSGILLSGLAAVFVNLGLSGKTRPGKKFPNLLFPIVVENIQLGKHGSDSDVYDTNGRFVASKFEEIFHKYARTNPNALTSDELDEFIKGNREPKDYGGWVGAFGEWKVLYLLAKDKDGLLQKDTIRGVYDGSLFEKLAEEKKNKSKKKHNDK